MIDFPASPVLNQTFTAPSGTTYKCTSAAPVVWTSMATQTAVPEAPIDGLYYARKDAAWAENAPFIEAPTDNGYYARRNAGWAQMTKAGAGLDQVDNTSDVNKPVSTAQANADNLRVLKTGDTMTGPLLLPAGTVAAPALAWSAESGLGWFRTSAQKIGMAAAGVQTFDFSAATAAASFMAMYPRVAGETSIYLDSDVVGAANKTSLAIRNLTTGYFIHEGRTGTGPAKALNLNFSAGVVSTSNLTATQFTVNGNGGQFYLSQDASNNYIGYIANSFIAQNKPTGNLAYTNNGTGGSGTTTTIHGAGGDFISGRNIYTGGDGGVALVNQGGARYLRWHTNGSKFQYDTPNVNFYNDLGTSVTNIFGGGGIQTSGEMYAKGPTTGPDSSGFNCYCYNDGIKNIRYYSSQNATGCGAVIKASDGATSAFFVLYHTGNAQAPGSWLPGSDGRVKTERVVLGDAVAKVEQLTGYTYKRTDLNTVDAGLIAQDVAAVIPEAITKSPQGDLEDFHFLNYNAVTALLVNAVKELSGKLDAALARIAQLEAP